MYVSIIEYRVHDLDEAAWRRTEQDLAHRFAEVPGLMSKIWLHGEGTMRGGVYVWQDKSASERFLASDLAAALRGHPNVEDLTVREYAVDEEPTRVTRGLVLGASVAYQYAW